MDKEVTCSYQLGIFAGLQDAFWKGPIEQQLKDLEIGLVNMNVYIGFKL